MSIINEIVKRIFDASASGAGILLGLTSSPGILIHTALAGNTTRDEVWIWVTNNTGSDAYVTISWAGLLGKDQVQYLVTARDGPKCVVPGWLLEDGASVYAWASASGALTVQGFVNRITEITT